MAGGDEAVFAAVANQGPEILAAFQVGTVGPFGNILGQPATAGVHNPADAVPVFRAPDQAEIAAGITLIQRFRQQRIVLDRPRAPADSCQFMALHGFGSEGFEAALDHLGRRGLKGFGLLFTHESWSFSTELFVVGFVRLNHPPEFRPAPGRLRFRCCRKSSGSGRFRPPK